MGETLSYAPRKAIKSQVLVDFLVEWTDTQLPSVQLLAKLWTMYFDGSLMKTGAGAGFLFILPLRVHMLYIIQLHFPASNNITEYEALVMGQRIAVELGVRHLDVRGDSQLVIDQVMKSLSCRDPKMEAYCEEVRRLEDKFHGLELNHIAHRYNEAIDELTKIASSRTTVPTDVFAKDLHQPSVNIRADGGVDFHHSTLYLRRKPPRPGLRPCKWKARPRQTTPSLTGVYRTSTISLEGTSPRIRSRLDGSLVGPNPL
jgi:ribonuclease HI